MLRLPATSFDSHMLKFKRAEEHYESLKSEMAAYIEPRPYRLIQEGDSQSGEYTFRLEITRQPPDHLAMMIGDCLQNLRSSLDHMLWQIVYRATGKDSGTCQFPIFGSRSHHDKRNRSGIKIGETTIQDVPKAAWGLIERLQPYNAANGPTDDNPLLLLTNLNNRDKHRVLQLTTFALANVDFVLRDLVDVDCEIVERAAPDWLEDGAVLARLKMRGRDPKVGGKMYFEYHVTGYVAFDAKGAGRAKPVMSTLDQMLRRVDEIFAAFRPYV
jgi:hypothetical protein